MSDEQQYDTDSAWAYQLELEVRRQAEELKSDPGYWNWIRRVDAETRTAEIHGLKRWRDDNLKFTSGSD